METQVVPTAQVVYPMVTNTTGRENFKGKLAVLLGSLQVTVGILCIIFQIVSIPIGIFLMESGAGIYCGAFYILAGAFGICAGKKKTTCFIVVFMALSIVAALSVSTILVFSGVGIKFGSKEFVYSCDDDLISLSDVRARNWTYIQECEHSHKYNADQVAISVILVILAVSEFVIAILSSAACCAEVCCTTSTRRGEVLYVVGNPEQVVIIPQPAQHMPIQNFVSSPSGSTPQNVCVQRVQQPMVATGEKGIHALPTDSHPSNSPPAYTEFDGGAMAAPLSVATPTEGMNSGQKQEEAMKGEAYNPSP